MLHRFVEECELADRWGVKRELRPGWRESQHFAGEFDACERAGGRAKNE